MFPSGGSAHARPETLFAGRYSVDGPLPWGGLATYYRAYAEDTPLILCVLPMHLGGAVRAESAFAELAQQLGSVSSKSLPTVIDAGVIDGVPYLAFQDTRGRMLSDLLKERPLRSLDVLRTGREVLDAMSAANEAGLVHGDLTPQNIILTRQRGGQLRAQVFGFGVLPLLRATPEASARAAHTGSGQHAVWYIAPELVGANAFHPGVDIFSAGALLHHMTTGEPPVLWETDEGFDDMPGLPEVIRRAMTKHPAGRYPTAASMRSALDWIEVESAKNNPETLDIAPWMEVSHVGSVPVPALNTSRPPAFVHSSHPAGKILSTSGARPIPIPPVVVDEIDLHTNRRLFQITLLLLLLGALAFAGYALAPKSGPGEHPEPGVLQAEHSNDS